MKDGLKDCVSALRATTPALNDATAEAADIVREVDALLTQELAIGISAELDAVFHSEPAPDEMTLVQRIGYGRVGGRYCLYISEALVDDQREVISDERSPWTNCSRETKLASFEHLPHLLGLLADKAADIQKRAKTTATTVRVLADAMAHGEGAR